MAKLPVGASFRVQPYKSRTDPNKPPVYDECLSIIDMRPHRRKDKSRPPGKIYPTTPSLPIVQPENRTNMAFGHGSGPHMNPAYGASIATPPLHLQPRMYQQSPLSPTAQDAEMIRCAHSLLDAVKAVWDDSGSETDSSDEEATAPVVSSVEVTSFEVPPASNPPLRRKRSSIEGSVEEAGHRVEMPRSPNFVSNISTSDLQNESNHESSQQGRSIPHVPIYITPSSRVAARPPRQGHIIKFGTTKAVIKLPTPPSEPSPTQTSFMPKLFPRQAPVTNQPGQQETRLDSHTGPDKMIPPGVLHYLSPQHPVIATEGPASRKFNAHPPPPTAFAPPVVGGFNPVNGNGIANLPPNQIQVWHSFVPPATGTRKEQHTPLLASLKSPKNDPSVQQSQQQASPPKNAAVVKPDSPGPAKDHTPREKPPKNGTIIDFGKTTRAHQRAASRKSKK
ncbi:hypothetical protein FKW77_009729 [Venturia effusa]|uniref:Uncharacterized protein n=1 Tax=Venturia effusa TaxID=50376 RepID=A0A517L4B5_9PEZI|nr:hypothetical protein FKW77_009729 [Venturia effusa]